MWFFLKNNNKKNISNDLLLLMPSFLIVFSITAYVLINTLKESLGLIPELFLNEITFKYYDDLFSNKVFLNSLLYSLFVALVSTVLSTVAGTYLGYVVSKTKGVFTNAMYKFPILLSYITAAALIYNTYSDNGLLHHMFIILGLNLSDLNIIYNANGIAVIILNMFKGIPFIAFSLYPIFLKTDKDYRETAKNLGCTNITYVYKILLPICMHSIMTSFLVVFNYNLFTYEGFYFLGPSNPISIGVLSYNAYINPDMSNRPLVMAINMVMIAVSMLLCIIFYKSIKNGRNEEMTCENIK